MPALGFLSVSHNPINKYGLLNQVYVSWCKTNAAMNEILDIQSHEESRRWIINYGKISFCALAKTKVNFKANFFLFGVKVVGLLHPPTHLNVVTLTT